MFEVVPFTWKQALASFLRRELLSRDEFYSLRDELRGMAWTISDIAMLQTLDRCQKKIAQIIKSGGTLQEFQKWARGTGWPRAYTELIFRNAVLGSYSKARWESVNDPALSDFDVFVYDAVNDSRTRFTHAAMDGKAYYRPNFPDQWWAPNGHNCRCEVRAMTAEMARAAGFRLQGSNPPPEEPDKGWRANQARDYAGVLEKALRDVRAGLEKRA